MRCAQALGIIGLLSCPPAWTQEPLKLDWDWMVSASHAQRNDSLVWAAAQMMNSSKWISGSIYSLAGKVGRRVLRSLATHSIEVMSRQKKRG